MKEFTVSESANKISKLIQKEYPTVGYSSLQRLFRKGDVRINGKKIYTDCSVSVGDTVRLYLLDKPFSPKIVYEDEHIIVFYKPVKIASEGEGSFLDAVQQNLSPDYILCHRLDTNTEGLLLFAKSNTVFEAIKNAFRNNQVIKKYIAVVSGDISVSQTLSDFILKDSVAGKVRIVKRKEEGAKTVITKITPIRRAGEHTVLDVVLITGRTHQIRAHLAWFGHPVIGDSKYGKEEINRKYRQKNQLLMAYALCFQGTDGCLSYLDGKIISIDTTKLLNF